MITVLILVILIILLVGGGLAFVSMIASKSKEITEESIPDISFDSQNLYRPIRSLRKAIWDLVENSPDPAVHAMAFAVTEEVRETHDRVVVALQTRDQLRKASEGHAGAQKELACIEQQRELAESPQEKLSFTKAYEAKVNELAEYEKAKAIIKKIEDEVELTKASLSELKAKLAVSGASVNATERAEDLRTTLSSLETIQSSIDEAQVMLRS